MNLSLTLDFDTMEELHDFLNSRKTSVAPIPPAAVAAAPVAAAAAPVQQMSYEN